MPVRTFDELHLSLTAKEQSLGRIFFYWPTRPGFERLSPREQKMDRYEGAVGYPTPEIILNGDLLLVDIGYGQFFHVDRPPGEYAVQFRTWNHVGGAAGGGIVIERWEKEVRKMTLSLQPGETRFVRLSREKVPESRGNSIWAHSGELVDASMGISEIKNCRGFEKEPGTQMHSARED
jgi:hypothetical protein